MAAVTVVVASYERPRMLRECVRSVVAARPDEVILMDDGSETFDPEEVMGREAIGVRWAAFRALPLTPERRLVSRRQGQLLNVACDAATCPVVTIICDDDLLHPGWLDAVRAAFDAVPGPDLVYGRWLEFRDGATPSEDDPCPVYDPRGMTAGNFAWRRGLARWPEDRSANFDDGFLHNCGARGVDVFGATKLDAIAGWRRDHPKAALHHSHGREFAASMLGLLREGALE